ncbi:hypothetical protein E2320_022942, partial [Naja naja]
MVCESSVTKIVILNLIVKGLRTIPLKGRPIFFTAFGLSVS